MSTLRIVNRTRGTVVGSRVTVADTWWSRARGYLGRRRPGEGEGLLLVPCRGIHTFGMTFPLDVLFLDSRGRVLESARQVRPWRQPLRVQAARYVLEVPVGTIDASETRQGDELAWMPPRGHGERRLSSGDAGSNGGNGARGPSLDPPTAPDSASPDLRPGAFP